MMSLCFVKCVFTVLLSTVISASDIDTYAPIVEALKDYVESNETFALQINQTFNEAGHGSNSSYPLCYDDMYNFLNQTLSFAPNATEIHLAAGTWFTFTSTKTGNQIVTTNKYIEWTQQWILTWTIYLDSYNSTSVIPTWDNYTNMSQYIIPSNGFQSFNQFFQRKINMTYRPISSPNNKSIVTVPCDGLFEYLIIDNLSVEHSKFMVKGEQFNLTQMLGDQSKADRFENGSLFMISLNFYDYHRYHSPVSGQVKEIDQFGGYYYYIPIGSAADQLTFDGNRPNDLGCDIVWSNVNRRGVMYLQDDTHPITAIVAVGIGEVSSVNFNVYVESEVQKGDEIGYFAYGGSTMVMLFANGVIKQTLLDVNTTVMVGQAIALLHM